MHKKSFTFALFIYLFYLIAVTFAFIVVSYQLSSFQKGTPSYGNARKNSKKSNLVWNKLANFKKH